MAYRNKTKVSKTKMFNLSVESANRLETVARENNLSQTEILETFLIEEGFLEDVINSITGSLNEQTDDPIES